MLREWMTDAADIFRWNPSGAQKAGGESGQNQESCEQGEGCKHNLCADPETAFRHACPKLFKEGTVQVDP